MSAMFEGGYKSENGSIYKHCEGESHYDVDWGRHTEPDYWLKICDDTPENRQKYHID